VPTADLEKYRVSNCTEQIGSRPVKSYSRDPENEFFLPRELADSRQQIAIRGVTMADKSEPAGIYQVWHKEDDGFVHAINVESGNLLGALIMPLVRDGEFGGDRVTYLIEVARPSTFGDVIVNPEGAAYEIHDYKGMGPRFKEIEFQHSKMPTTEQNRPVRPLTEQLIDAVLLDAWPGKAAIVDFGIDSTEHLGALQYAIKFGEVTPQELDAAMGNGAKLTEIVQRGENPYRDVTFHTSWDKMFLESPEEPGGQDNKALFAEIRADEHAARVRDYGEADAATYDQRVRDGAATVNHLPPELAPLTEPEMERAVFEAERSWSPITDKTRFASILHEDTKREVAPERGSKDYDREM
jgi:hypothetical protein